MGRVGHPDDTKGRWRALVGDGPLVGRTARVRVHGRRHAHAHRSRRSGDEGSGLRREGLRGHRREAMMPSMYRVPRRILATTTRLLVVMAAAAASVARQANAQAAVQQAADPTARLAERLDAETHASVMKVVESAREQQLPVEPIVSKALLGATFRQPSAVITQSVNVVLQRLVASRDALAPEPTAGDIRAGAEAIALGVPSKTIRDLHSKFPGRSMVVRVAVVGRPVS